MKASLLICFLFCGAALVQGQSVNEFAYVDEKALLIPAAATHSVSAIAAYVQSNFTTEVEQLRAIYKWVTANLEYDKDSMRYRHWDESPEAISNEMLRKRSGVCGDFSTLFAAIAMHCAVKAVVVTGYTRQSGVVKWAGHSWCAVYVNGQWLLCDPTWDAGFASTSNYFLIPPEQFIETHMPVDPLWQLLPYPLTHKAFRTGSSKFRKEGLPINVPDSVKNYLALDTMQQLEAASARIKWAGIDNEDLRIWYAYNEMKVVIVQQEADMELYNLAVADLNRARKYFNDFVLYRNSRFVPEKPAAVVHAIFDTIATRIAHAYTTIALIGKKTENYQYDTGELKSSLEALQAKAGIQKDFFKRYLSGSTAERAKLF
jgi:hypothetical protein